VVQLISAGRYSLEGEKCRLRQLDELMNQGHRFAVLVDSHEERTSERGRFSIDWINSHQEELKRHCAGVAILVRGLATRFFLSSALLVVKQPIPYKVFDDPDSAIRWARQRVDETAR
jgi:hypothetical protein